MRLQVCACNSAMMHTLRHMLEAHGLLAVSCGTHTLLLILILRWRLDGQFISLK